jgi:thiol-disulfide isomerase/thioredoxin
MILSKFSKWMLASILVLGIFYCVKEVMPGETRVVVAPMKESTLDTMITNKENRLVISFMAAWCGPCIDELPVLNNLYRKYKDQGLSLVGISIDLEGAAAIQPLIKALKIDFPVYWYGEKAIQKFNLTNIPLLLFVKQGKICERIPGRRTQKFLDKKIQTILD